MRRCADEGSATIWVMLMAAILGLAGIVVVTISAGFVEHRRAAAAADLAALAGATVSTTDERPACLAAARVASANGAQLSSCEVAQSAVLVYVVIDPTNPWLPPMQVPARAGYQSP